MTVTLKDSTQFRVKRISIMTKGGAIDVAPLYDEINIYDSLFMPMLSGNILITDTVGLSKALNFDGSEVIFISEIVKKILQNYLKLENNEKGIFENSFGIKKVVIPNLNPIDAIEWCTKRSVDNKNAPSFVFFSNLIGYNYTSLSSLLKKDSILRIKFDPKNINDGDALNEISSARGFELVVLNDSIDKIRSGVNAGKFIGFDPLTRSFNEKNITFNDHYNSVDHLNKNPNKTEIFNKDNTTNYTSINSRKVLSIFGTNRKNSSYIKKNDPDSISKIEDYENFSFQRRAIFKNLIAKRMRVVMPGNFQLTSGFNVEVLTSGFSRKSKGSENDDVSLNGKYLIVAARHTLTNNKHETLIEIATDSTTDARTYTSNPQQNELLKRA